MLKAAWSDCGMSGAIAFSLIRTAISIEVRCCSHSSLKFIHQHAFVQRFTPSLSLFSQAKKHLSPADRALVAESMCHDVSTANRFYTKVTSLSEAFHFRDLRTQAMEDSAEPLDDSTDQELGSSESSSDIDPDNEIT